MIQMGRQHVDLERLTSPLIETKRGGKANLISRARRTGTFCEKSRYDSPSLAFIVFVCLSSSISKWRTKRTGTFPKSPGRLQIDCSCQHMKCSPHRALSIPQTPTQKTLGPPEISSRNVFLFFSSTPCFSSTFQSHLRCRITALLFPYLAEPVLESVAENRNTRTLSCWS